MQTIEFASLQISIKEDPIPNLYCPEELESE